MTAGPTGSPLLAADHVTRRFGRFTAVDRVSLTVSEGEIVGLLGANGAGKTTLIRMMLGLLPSSEGNVALFGATPTRSSRRRLGYVPQGLGLYLDMTVAENVSFNAGAFGISPGEIVLNDELEGMRDRLVGSIGLGRQRQLAFACALGHSPELLVLDEPTSGVDPLARARLWDVIRSQAHRGVGVLVTTHYMEEAQQCDRLVLMAAGTVAAEGTVEDIVADRTVVEVTAASWSEAFAALGDAGHDLVLAGRRIRVAADPSQVEATLRQAGIDAELEVVPAILEEAMVAVSAGP
jgi:ABC-2 type transport system ATP-binding protein/ribosome-dependent ATPase